MIRFMNGAFVIVVNMRMKVGSMGNTKHFKNAVSIVFLFLPGADEDKSPKMPFLTILD